jgi:four helix bundle protein
MFEDLRIWQESRVLLREIYRDFGAGTTGHRDSGFRQQIQCAGLSVLNNIAEGFERRTDSDFAKFLDIAKASCGEVRCMYHVAEDLGYVAGNIAEERRGQSMQIARGIAALAKHLRLKNA